MPRVDPPGHLFLSELCRLLGLDKAVTRIEIVADLDGPPKVTVTYLADSDDYDRLKLQEPLER